MIKEKRKETSASKDAELRDLLNASVLPMQISETGSDGEPLLEVIVCSSISGGARYKNNMPEELTLIRRLSDGTEYQMKYKQSV